MTAAEVIKMLEGIPPGDIVVSELSLQAYGSFTQEEFDKGAANPEVWRNTVVIGDSEAKVWVIA